MAAPIRSNLGQAVHKFCLIQPVSSLSKTQSSWSKLFKRKDEKEAEGRETDVNLSVRKHKPVDGPRAFTQLESLKKKTSLVTVRGYRPPSDVEQKVKEIARAVLGIKEVKPSYALTDRQQKFQVLTKLMEEFDHPIPNTELTSMNTLKDAIEFFSVPIRDQSSYEDFAKLDLPPNLHIQMEPLRFNPETDTFFDGQTAYPRRPTVVTSLKYSRKYKGNQGESRNERNMSEFERNNASKYIS